MTPSNDAKAHLAKSQEFLASAEDNLALGRLNAATSDAVISGIDAKDAICLKLTGRTGAILRPGGASSRECGLVPW